MIDILNISLVSRFPTYISGLFAINPVLERVSKEVLKNMEHPEKIQLATLDLVIVLIISLLSIFMLVYSIILLVNGFRVSTNTKKAKHFVFFIIALILAEVIAKTLVYNI
ncbi:YIP1 family protein [Fluviicola sp.]|uniref:YIP1 family protein n=1 Tax=Fluviicola sp. TaxID=1917219 RepID=UPI0028382B7F|nr:YIP1 family protein [Fluviicola sp.]MDR0801135.1 YIP1 family protein [Fluviicola sp.]